MKSQGPFVGGPMTQTTALMVIEKRSGKRMVSYEPGETSPRDNYPGGPFHSLEMDGRNGKIEFTSPQERISITLESDKPAGTTP
jgi:hypothetical protein